MPTPGVERILSAPRELPAMNELELIDPEALILEVTRYLAAVDAFRAENYEPTWLSELASRATALAQHATACADRVQPAH